jgi:hypothetical protein
MCGLPEVAAEPLGRIRPAVAVKTIKTTGSVWRPPFGDSRIKSAG